RIRSLASSVRRWLIGSPIRLTTASTPSSATCGGRSEVGSHRCQVTAGFEELARAGSRLRPTTSSPRASSASQTAEPIIPLAPVTSTRIATSSARQRDALIDRREAPGLLREPREAGALRFLDDGRGHGRGDVAIEDAGDHVVLGEI